MDFYKELQKDPVYKKAIENKEQPFIDYLKERINNKFPFRYYQKEALSVLHLFLSEKPDFSYRTGVNEQIGPKVIPFYGFEMATGSGKTILIAANIVYLYETKKIKNFLIITPTKTIYNKTIKNFDINDQKCMFSSNLKYKFNLITGENYTNRSNNYDENADFNIFVFNISKFYETEKHSRKIDKPWEESVWRDENGDTISLRDFLRYNRLAIITDEAHHYQNFKISEEGVEAADSGRGLKSSGEVISDLEPELVIEYTATAITDDSQRRNQKLIYKYSINDFIGDGFGKKIYALGRSGSIERTEIDMISDDDKDKLVLSILVHLLKKKATEDLIKPVLLVRARSKEHADNVNNYIQNILPNEIDMVKSIYNSIKLDRGHEIIKLIYNYISEDDLIKYIKELPKKAFSIHYQNRDNKEINERFESIETSPDEVIIQIKIAEEGWNVDNVYTILILSINEGDIKTYVKQLIGRGLRLCKEQREFDNGLDFFMKEQEILHVICDKGNNFARFVETIRKELNISESNLKEETKIEQRKNETNSSFEKYNSIELPIVKQENKMDTTNLMDMLTYKKLEIDKFIEDNTRKEKGLLFIKVFEEEQTQEFADLVKETKESDPKGVISDEKFSFEVTEIRKVVRELVEKQGVLPSYPAVKDKLFEEISKINTKELYYKHKYGTDRRYFSRILVTNLIKFLYKKINDYFELENVYTNKPLKELFISYNISAEINLENNEEINLCDIKNLHIIKTIGTIELAIKRGRFDQKLEKNDLKNYFFYNFKKSFYQFSKFDSTQELELAEIIDSLNEVDFWIKNTRDKNGYYYEYGMGQKYFPDFIVKVRDTIYIIEIKGEVYLDKISTKKKKDLLMEISGKFEKVKTIFLIHTTVEDKLFRNTKNFDEIIANNDINKEDL